MVRGYCSQCGRRDGLRKRLSDWWYWSRIKARTKNVLLIPSIYTEIKEADNHKFRIKSRIKIDSKDTLDEICDYKGTIEEAAFSHHELELNVKDRAVGLGADIAIYDVDISAGLKRYRAQLYARPSNFPA